MTHSKMFSDSSDDDDNQPRPPRRFKIRNDFENEDFKRRFRLTRGSLEALLLRIGGDLQHETGRSAALTPQVLVYLRVVASNSIYSVISDAHGISMSSVSRCVHRVCESIVLRCYNDIHFPENAADLSQQFFNFAGMPAVAGCIDGTHIDIQAPHLDEYQYVNRHHRHSINVMAVCGPDMKMYYINARWPGATNDSRVLRNSSLAADWNGGYRPFPDAVILGDSGYPCLPTMASNTD